MFRRDSQPRPPISFLSPVPGSLPAAGKAVGVLWSPVLVGGRGLRAHPIQDAPGPLPIKGPAERARGLSQLAQGKEILVGSARDWETQVLEWTL